MKPYLFVCEKDSGIVIASSKHNAQKLFRQIGGKGSYVGEDTRSDNERWKGMIRVLAVESPADMSPCYLPYVKVFA